MNQGGILILIIVYVLVVAFGIRALLADKVLPPHLKVLGIIVILVFNIIPVGVYLLLRGVKAGKR
ncbi:hypothetical protein LQ567_11595 [Niabella pedocola]|uniref:Cardiolipin synthase N-terminal domain-containing protein n=1 Tax=Niabella pedocola TaxID=1752077 RepID=A0ABS8PQN7_9BACT|nr:hypothetical protein [Niabella pedocola]MCD2423408.1 hypothetical protein [Niabella pedocola]